jgi:hypothetical protein
MTDHDGPGVKTPRLRADGGVEALRKNQFFLCADRSQAVGTKVALGSKTSRRKPVQKLFMSRFLLILFTLSVAIGHVVADPLSKQDKAAGKKIYDSKCVKCHRPYDPRDYREEEWRLWIAKMSKKAKLKPQPEKLLNRYLDVYRSERPERLAAKP